MIALPEKVLGEDHRLHHRHENRHHHHYHQCIIIIMINLSTCSAKRSPSSSSRKSSSRSSMHHHHDDLSTCSAEITDILLSSLSFKGISRPPCGTNYVIVCVWICGIITFLFKYIMYIVYCNCIFGLEAIINGERSESQSAAY